MTKNLQSSWTVGKTRFTHAGYGVYKLLGLNSPADRMSDLLESAQKAIETAEKFGEGYAAFRIVRSSGGVEAKELLSREDLPVHLV